MNNSSKMSVPYHTRSDSKPFSYSVRSRSSSLNRREDESPREQPGSNGLSSMGLASPRLIRKMLGETLNSSPTESSPYTTINHHQENSNSCSSPLPNFEESFREVPIQKSNLGFYELSREKDLSPKTSNVKDNNYTFDMKRSSFDDFISKKKSSPSEDYYFKKTFPDDIYATSTKTTIREESSFVDKPVSPSLAKSPTLSDDFYSKKTTLDDIYKQKTSSPDDLDLKRNPFEDFDYKKKDYFHGDSLSGKSGSNETYHVPIKLEKSFDESDSPSTLTSMADVLMNKKNDETWLEKQLQKLKERKGVLSSATATSTVTTTTSINNGNPYKSPTLSSNYSPNGHYTKMFNNDQDETDLPSRSRLISDEDRGVRVPITRDDKPYMSDISSYTLGHHHSTLERQRLDGQTSNDRSRSSSGIRRQRMDSESSELGALDTSTLHQKLMAASLENGSSSRPITPAFPPGTPYNNRSRANTRAPSPCGLYSTTQRRGSVGSIHSSEISGGEESANNVKLVKDNFKYWYKPSITREEAIALLKPRPPGTFIVRDSHSFPGAYGLALKVSKAPPASAKPKSTDPLDELVRHFLIEPTTKGVRLKGYSNEPIFASLSSLVYQHSLTALALPTKLVLPQYDLTLDNFDSGGMSNNIQETKQDSMRRLFDSGAACNVSYLFTMETDALTGAVAVDKTISTFLELTKDIDNNPGLVVVDVHFKVTTQGITITDNERKLFFRKHYNISTIGYCGLDPQNRTYVKASPATKIFAFVAKKHGSRTNNQCHIFAALDPEQPAVAIVNFVNRVLAMTNPKRIDIV